MIDATTLLERELLIALPPSAPPCTCHGRPVIAFTKFHAPVFAYLKILLYFALFHAELFRHFAFTASS